MGKIFNVNANCIPRLHYMVDLTDRLRQVRSMVDDGQYFTINRARQSAKRSSGQKGIRRHEINHP